MVGIFKLQRLLEAIIREPGPLSWNPEAEPESATRPLHPTSISYASLHHPFSQHCPALPPIPWRNSRPAT
jgi:hypothetical protein